MTRAEMDACVDLLQSAIPNEVLRDCEVYTNPPISKEVVEAAKKCGAVLILKPIEEVFKISMENDEGW